MTFAVPPEPDDAVRMLASEQAARADSEAAADALRRLEVITTEAFVDASVRSLLHGVAERIADVLRADAVAVHVTVDPPIAVLAGRRQVAEDVDAAAVEVIAAGAARVSAGVHGVDLGSAPADLAALASAHGGVLAMASAPVQLGSEVLGAIVMARAPEEPFERDDVGVLQLSADRVAIALDRALAHEREREARAEAERAHAHVERLYQLTTDLIQLTDETAIGELLLAELVDATGAATGAVYERDELSADLRRVAVRGEREEGWQHANPPHLTLGDEGAAARATREAALVVLRSDPALGPGAPRDGMRLAAPLLTMDGTARGALVLGFHEADAPLPDSEWLQGVAGQGALAFERRRLANERARMYASERAARAQADARAQAARILDGIGEGIVLVDGAGLVRTWNPAAASVTGMPSSVIVGAPLAEAWPRLAEQLDHVPLDVDPRSPSSREVVQVDVEERALWLSLSAMTTRDGTVVAFRDVTETHLVERLRSELVATVSHELRTPISSVLGAIKTLRDPALALDETAREQLLAIIDDQAERLVAIVEDMLQVHRLDTGIETVRQTDVDLVALARAACERHERRGVHARVVEGADARVVVPSDPVRLAQVVDNLLDNARAYGGGSPVDVRVSVSGDHARLEVRDHGPGIPPGEHARIFEKFYRLDPDMRRDGGGNGLGLYICRRLVERMGGSIRVDEEVADGAAFVIELPLTVPSGETGS